jgi:hypothetical protein
MKQLATTAPTNGLGGDNGTEKIYDYNNMKIKVNISRFCVWSIPLSPRVHVCTCQQRQRRAQLVLEHLRQPVVQPQLMGAARRYVVIRTRARHANLSQIPRGRFSIRTSAWHRPKTNRPTLSGYLTWCEPHVVGALLTAAAGVQHCRVGAPDHLPLHLRPFVMIRQCVFGYYHDK